MSERFEMRVSAEWLAMLDEWRAHRRPIFTRTAAVHTLTAIGMGLVRREDQRERDLDSLTETIARSQTGETELPICCFRVGDFMTIAGHRYMIHIADRNRLVLAPYLADEPEIKVSVI